MGNSGTKLQSNASDPANVDRYVDEMVSKLKLSIDSLGKNDLKSMKETVTSMPASQRLNSGMINHIVKVISNTETALEMANGPKRSYNNNDLRNYIDSITKRKVASIRDGLERDNIRIESPALQKSVDELFSPVANMHTKYKFYFYKYVQLNIFLILFANHVQEVMNIQFAQILDYTRKQSLKDEELIKTLTTTMSRIADIDDPKVDAPQRDDIEKLSADAMEAASSRVKNLEQFVDKMKKNSFEEIIKIFVDTQEQIVKEVEQFKRPI